MRRRSLTPVPTAVALRPREASLSSTCPKHDPQGSEPGLKVTRGESDRSPRARVSSLSISTSSSPCQDADPQRSSLRLSGIASPGSPRRRRAPTPSSLPAPRLPMTVRPQPASRLSIHGLPLSASALTCHAPRAADRLGLALDVGEKCRVVISLQPLLDEGP